MNQDLSFLPTPNQIAALASIACLLILSPSRIGCADAYASDSPDQITSEQGLTDAPQAWYHHIDAEWGGHLKATGLASWPDERTIYQYVGTRTYYDGGLDFRLKNKLFFSTWGNFETHYEAILYGGDTRRKTKEIQNQYPSLTSYSTVQQETVNDDDRLMNLTHVIKENDSYILYQRLDRFVLTWQPEWGTAKIGRQAVTWGNGLLFNPMDLFNPFAPTDVIRDYKIGTDMANLAINLTPGTDMQMLYVPRRDPELGEVEWEQSSLTGKMHLAPGTTEFDLMAAYHYQDYIVGVGSTGYWGNAAWRLDATWTILNSEYPDDDYLSLVANIDYSWFWHNKNIYGFVEYFYNGLGQTDYSQALLDPNITERIRRGELYTLGRHYLNGQIQLELHPLFNTFFTIITNINDPSGVIQPWGTWDIKTDLQCTLGANLNFGETGTEYGGFSIPGTPVLHVPADSVYVWLTYYF